MTSRDYAWEDPANQTRIGVEAVPGRFALTAPQVIVRDDGRFLLVDPHPAGSWETWMFPYASVVVSTDEASTRLNDDGEAVVRLTGSSTLADVTTTLHRIRRAFKSEYDAAVADGVSNLLPTIEGAGADNRFYENYSLKFSKSSAQYTAYAFEYFLAHPPVVPSVAIPHLWVLATDFVGFDSSRKIEDRTISTNVLEALPAIRALPSS